MGGNNSVFQSLFQNTVGFVEYGITFLFKRFEVLNILIISIYYYILELKSCFAFSLSEILQWCKLSHTNVTATLGNSTGRKLISKLSLTFAMYNDTIDKVKHYSFCVKYLISKVNAEFSHKSRRDMRDIYVQY